jgi:hypothetical protein
VKKHSSDVVNFLHEIFMKKLAQIFFCMCSVFENEKKHIEIHIRENKMIYMRLLFEGMYLESTGICSEYISVGEIEVLVTTD